MYNVAGKIDPKKISSLAPASLLQDPRTPALKQ
jgi:hypothetical protein